MSKGKEKSKEVEEAVEEKLKVGPEPVKKKKEKVVDLPKDEETKEESEKLKEKENSEGNEYKNSDGSIDISKIANSINYVMGEISGKLDDIDLENIDFSKLGDLSGLEGMFNIPGVPNMGTGDGRQRRKPSCGCNPCELTQKLSEISNVSQVIGELQRDSELIDMDINELAEKRIQLIHEIVAGYGHRR